jgi:hypothetical protein
MFQDLDTTLANILEDGAAPAHLVAAEVSFATPDNNYAPQQGDTAVNLFLHEVKENRELRDLVPIPQQIGNRYLQCKPPLRVDCAYLVTAWSKEKKVADEHELLGLAFAWLSRFPVIPENYFAKNLASQPYPPPSLVAQWDAAKNVGEFWSALGIAPRPFFNLIVTVAMDLDQVLEDAIVKTVMTTYHAADPASAEELIVIGGTVRDRDGNALGNAWVRLEPAGLTQVTDAAGRFVFTGVARGAGMTLRARAPGFGEAVRRPVEVPSITRDYDLNFS